MNVPFLKTVARVPSCIVASFPCGLGHVALRNNLSFESRLNFKQFVPYFRYSGNGHEWPQDHIVSDLCVPNKLFTAMSDHKITLSVTFVFLISYSLMTPPPPPLALLNPSCTMLAKTTTCIWRHFVGIPWSSHLCWVPQKPTLVPQNCNWFHKTITKAEMSPLSLEWCCNAVMYQIQHSLWICVQEYRPERFSEENCNARNPYAFIPFSAGPRLVKGAATYFPGNPYAFIPFSAGPRLVKGAATYFPRNPYAFIPFSAGPRLVKGAVTYFPGKCSQLWNSCLFVFDNMFIWHCTWMFFYWIL